MEKIVNTSMVTAEDLLPRLIGRYPKSKIKKPLFAPKTIFIPIDNYKLLIQPKKDFIKLDYMPPVLWSVGSFIILLLVLNGILYAAGVRAAFIGGALPAIIAFAGSKAVFKSQKKNELETNFSEIKYLINNRDENSIFS